MPTVTYQPTIQTVPHLPAGGDPTLLAEGLRELVNCAICYVQPEYQEAMDRLQQQAEDDPSLRQLLNLAERRNKAAVLILAGLFGTRPERGDVLTAAVEWTEEVLARSAG